MPKKKKTSKKKNGDKTKKKKESLRIVSTIAPSSENKKSGLERDMDEVDLERFSEFITPISKKSSVPSLDVVVPIRKLEEVTPVRNDSKKEEKEMVSYGSNIGNAYADSGAYVSDSGRKYGGGADGKVNIGNDDIDLGKRKDFIKSDARDFISPELRDQKDDYQSNRDRAYNAGQPNSINRKDLGDKGHKF
jgi:hypothetical protein